MKRPEQAVRIPKPLRWDRVTNRAPVKGQPQIVTRGSHAGMAFRNQTRSREHLTWQDALALIDAEQFAAKKQIPLTTFLTIAWKYGIGFDGDDARTWKTALDRLRRAARQHLNSRGIPIAWLFVNERAERVGGHTHFLMHMPAAEWRTETRLLKEHLKAKCRMPSGYSISIRSSSRLGSITPKQRLGVIKYICKTMNPDEVFILKSHAMGKLTEFIGIAPAPSVKLPEGLQRIGVTENIAASARSRAGWIDKVSRLDLADELLRYGNTGLLKAPATGCYQREP